MVNKQGTDITVKSTKKGEKRGRGQPTKYKKAHCQALIDFFDVEPWEEREIPHCKGGEVVWTDIKRLPRRMPTLRAFAKKIGVGIATIYGWIDEKHGSYQEDFSYAFTLAKEIRKDWLIDVGLSGGCPPLAFKFVAVNCTDMRDRQVTEHEVSKDMVTLLGLIDGSNKGKLPTEQEGQNAGK